MKLTKKSLVKSMQLFLIMGLLVFQYQNCAQHNDPSPFELPMASLTDESKLSNIRLSSPSGNLDVSIYESMISLGGECAAGGSSRHYIELKLQDQNNTPIPLRAGSCPECFRLVNARCEHGKYNAVVPVECVAYRNQTTSLYRITGQMVTLDTNGNEFREPTAVFDRFFQIAWSPGSCP